MHVGHLGRRGEKFHALRNSVCTQKIQPTLDSWFQPLVNASRIWVKEAFPHYWRDLAAGALPMCTWNSFIQGPAPFFFWAPGSFCICAPLHPKEPWIMSKIFEDSVHQRTQGSLPQFPFLFLFNFLGFLKTKNKMHISSRQNLFLIVTLDHGALRNPSIPTTEASWRCPQWTLSHVETFSQCLMERAAAHPLAYKLVV